MGVKSITCNCGAEVEVKDGRPVCTECDTAYDLHGQGLGVGAATSPSTGGGSSRAKGKSAEDNTIEFYRKLGCRVYEVRPFYTAKGISKGIPDLTVFADGMKNAPAPFWYHEVKAGNSRQSPEQREFQQLCEEAGIPYVLGDSREAARFLGFDV